MSRIATMFDGLRKRNKKAMIPFITAGDPELAATVPMMLDLVGSGADLIELGVPFSDPMADGPVIQQAGERALAQGTGLTDVLHIVQTFRQHDQQTPVILMGYLNPLETMGYAGFAQQAEACGVDGVLIVDLPPEEAASSLHPLLKSHGLDQIFLFSPTTTDSRMELISRYASGFVYCVAVKGVTGAGARQIDTQSVEDKIIQMQQHTKLPIAAGFAIGDATVAKAVGGFCDAIVIGSALIEQINNAVERGRDVSAEIKSFLSPVRAALDQL
ncbi:MAG: tryptophan synthase subunit alpha [Gammaproteobacteria bacterium]